MEKIFLLVLILLAAGCSRSSEPEITEIEADKDVEVIVKEEEELTSKPDELSVKERIAERYQVQRYYLINELPDDIYNKLCGSWGRFFSEPDSMREFSWGEAPHYSRNYLIFDFGVVPPLYITGQSEGNTYGYDLDTAEILSVGVIQEDKYALIFLTLDDDPTELYIILTTEDKDTMDLNIHDRYSYNPDMTHRHYKISGPVMPVRIKETAAEEAGEKEVDSAEWKLPQEKQPAPGSELEMDDFTIYKKGSSKTISMGQDIEEVSGLFDELSKSSDGYFVDGLSIEAVGGKVDYMLCEYESAFVTLRGIELGSSSADVAVAYGGESGKSEYTYYYSVGDVLSTHILGFSIANDKVDMIIYNISSP